MACIELSEPNFGSFLFPNNHVAPEFESSFKSLFIVFPALNVESLAKGRAPNFRAFPACQLFLVL